MKNIISFCFLISLFFFGCKKNDAPSTEIPVGRVKTTITGIVTNEAGQFLQGASVSIEGKTVTTDREGLFMFEDIEVPESRYYVKATLNNYFESGSGGIAVKDGVTTLQIKLMSMGTTKDVSATAASTNAIGGATIKFDAGSFVNQNGTAVTSGTIRVNVRSLNPDNPDFSDLVPGGDLNSTMPDGSPATLESFGMVGVELRDANNNELKLATGKQAEIRFPIASSQLTTAPAEIPLLSMDPESGEWKQEGVATKVGSEYVGKVGHFSWWNCDVLNRTCIIRGRVVDCEGKPMAGVRVIVNNQHSLITDVNGYYQRRAPRIPLRFQVKIHGLIQTLANTVALNNPTAGLNILPDIKVGAVGNCPTTITGTVTRCNNDKPFYIRLIWGQNSEGWVPNLVQGDTFRLTVPAGKPLIIRYSSGTFVRDTAIAPLTIGQTLNIGQLSGCISLPKVITGSISTIAQNSAITGGEVVSNGGGPITARGVVWGTNPGPTISLTTKTNNGTGMGIFTSNLTGLSAGTKYYVRAYATNNAGTSYGNELSFTGLDENIFNPNLNYGTVTDIDGNVYKTILIGNQTWMAENLKVSRYRNGVSIQNITDNNQWQNNTSGAWCYYNNDSLFNDPYGKLYNWYAAVKSDSICPPGWHIPSSGEWSGLINFLGGELIAGGKMKSSGTNYWQSPNTSASNSSAFSGLPGGMRTRDGQFLYIKLYGHWWEFNEISNIRASYNYLLYNLSEVFRPDDYKTRGYSIRCIKD